MRSNVIDNFPTEDILPEEGRVEQPSGTSVMSAPATPPPVGEQSTAPGSYYTVLDARFGSYGEIFRCEGNDYRALRRVVSYLLPRGAFLTWETIFIFHMFEHAPFPGIRHVAWRRGVTPRAIEQNLQYMRDCKLLERRLASHKGRPVLTYHFEGLYELARDYLLYEKSPQFIDWRDLTPEFAPLIPQELRRFLIYDKIARGRPRGRKRKNLEGDPAMQDPTSFSAASEQFVGDDLFDDACFAADMVADDEELPPYSAEDISSCAMAPYTAQVQTPPEPERIVPAPVAPAHAQTEPPHEPNQAAPCAAQTGLMPEPEQFARYTARSEMSPNSERASPTPATPAPVAPPPRPARSASVPPMQAGSTPKIEQLSLLDLDEPLEPIELMPSAVSEPCVAPPPTVVSAFPQLPTTPVPILADVCVASELPIELALVVAEDDPPASVVQAYEPSLPVVQEDDQSVPAIVEDDPSISAAGKDTPSASGAQEDDPSMPATQEHEPSAEERSGRQRCRGKQRIFPSRPSVEEGRQGGTLWVRGKPLPPGPAQALRKISLKFHDDFPRSSQTQASKLFDEILKLNSVRDAYTIRAPERYFADLMESICMRLQFENFTCVNQQGQPNGMPLFFSMLRQQVQLVVREITALRNEEALRRFQSERAQKMAGEDVYGEYAEGQLVEPYGQPRTDLMPPCPGVRFSLREMSCWHEEDIFTLLSADELVALAWHYDLIRTEQEAQTILTDADNGELACRVGLAVRICAYHEMVSLFENADVSSIES